MQSVFLDMSAGEAAAKIASRQISPVAYLEAVLAAARAAQSTFNPFVVLLEEQAVEQARVIEAEIARGHVRGPLAGVPISVKDQVDVAGVRTTYSSAVSKPDPAAADDVLIARLRKAGAVVFAKTTMSEFGHKAISDSPAFGITRNPWDRTRTPGGSSGGAAAAVALGVGPFALGMDAAGSIRIPAACCGLVGLKPTLGAVPWQQGTDAFGNYVTGGPIARKVADTAILFDALRGPFTPDPWTLAERSVDRVSARLLGSTFHGLRFGLIEHMANDAVDDDVWSNTTDMAAAIQERGGVVETVDAPIDWIEMAGRIIYYANYAVAFSHLGPDELAKIDPTFRLFIERGNTFGMKELREAHIARTRLYRDVQALFSTYDFLVTPTLTRTALPADFDAGSDQVVVNGRVVGDTRNSWTSYVYPFNLTGNPALTIPSGFAGDGLPTGLQIVGPWGADFDLLRIGSTLEDARPRSRPWPSPFDR